MLFPIFNLYETPIVEVTKADLTNSPFTILLDFSFSRVSIIALKFLMSLSSAKDFDLGKQPKIRTSSPRNYVARRLALVAGWKTVHCISF